MRVFLIALIALTFSVNLLADPPKQLPGTDGELIEQEFKSIVNNCFGEKNVKYSTLFFPNLLRNTPYKTILEKPVNKNRIIDGAQFSLLASTVFVDQMDITSSLKDLGQSSFIKLPKFESVSLDNANNLTFALTCTTALKLAMDQNFEFTTSFLSNAISVAIKQALQVQSSRDKASSLGLMYGTFYSPLFYALESIEPADKAYASSTIWQYYISTNGKTPSTENARYLKSIKGWLITRLNSQDLASLVGASIDSKNSLFGIDANLGSSAKYVFNTNLKDATSRIILDDEINAARDIAPLPNPKELSASINKAALFFPQDVVPFQKGKPISLTLKILSVPPWLCTSRWSVKTIPETKTSMVNATHNAATNQCDMNFKTTVTTSLDKLETILRNEDYPILFSNAAPQHIQLFHTFALNAQVESEPILSAPPVVKYNPDQANPTFNVTIAFSLMPSDTDIEVITKKLPTIKCPASIAQPNLYPATETSIIAKNQYASNMSVTFNDNNFVSTDCDIKVPVSFKLKNIEVDKELPPLSLKFNKPSN